MSDKLQELDSKELPVNPVDKLVVDAMAKEAPKSEAQEIFYAFQATLNKFIDMVSNYQGSKKQLQRVMINLAISPMNSEDLYFDPGYPAEKELFDIGNEVNSAKMFLMLQNMVDSGKVIMVESEELKSAPLSDEEKESLARLKEADDQLKETE